LHFNKRTKTCSERLFIFIAEAKPATTETTGLQATTKKRPGI